MIYPYLVPCGQTELAANEVPRQNSVASTTPSAALRSSSCTCAASAPQAISCTLAHRKTASRILNRLKVGKFLLQPLSPAQRETFRTIAAGRWACLSARHLEWLEHYDRETQPCKASNPVEVVEVCS
jgi:hypothetical protein